MARYINLRTFLLLILNSINCTTEAFITEESILQQQVQLVMELMVKLHNIHNFDNIIIYRTPGYLYEPPVETGLMLKTLNHHKPLNNNIICKSVGNILAAHVFSSQLYKPLMIFTIAPWDYANNTKAIPNLGNILTNKNLAVVILNDIFNNELKEFVALSLGASLETKIVFLVIGHEMTGVFAFVRLEKMKRFFRWCWSRNLLNAVLLFQKDHIKHSLHEMSLEVYTYTPFPRPIQVLYITDQQPKDYFPDRTKDLLGYRFKTPVFADKPHVFKSEDPYTGLETITGISGFVYMEYVKHINATFQEIEREQEFNGSWVQEMDYIYDLLNARNIDISIHPLTALRHHFFHTSYPITNTNSCVVVPVIPEIYRADYLALTLSVKMWFLMLLSFIVFQMAYMFVHHNNYGSLRAWLAFATTLKGLLNMPVGNMGHFKTISRNSLACQRKIVLHMWVLLTGMIYSQTFIAALTSFLSSTLYPQQIESIEDLRKANISIMLVEYMYDTYNYLDLIPDNFSDHLIITDAETVSEHLNKLDTSYAYTVFKEEWKVMQRLQMNLWKPRFRIVPALCIPNVYMNLPLQFNSPFYNSLKRFILRMQSTGLELKWSDMVYWQIQKESGVNGTMMETLEHPVPLTFLHLMYIFYVYAGGMILASIVFSLELLWAKKLRKLKTFLLKL